MSKYSDIINNFSGFDKTGGREFDDLIDKINDVKNIKDIGKILNVADISPTSASAILNNSKFSDDKDGIQKIMSSYTGNKNGITSLGGAFISFLSSTGSQLALLATAATGIIYLADKIMPPSYEELQQTSSTSAMEYSNAQAESAAVKQSITDIDARIKAINSQTLALTNPDELASLQAQKKALEETQTLKDNIATAKQEEMALDASNAMKAKSRTNRTDVSDILESEEVSTERYNYRFDKAPIPPKKSYTDQEALTSEITDLNELKEKKQELESEIEMSDEKSSPTQTKNYEDIVKGISDLESDLKIKHYTLSNYLTRMTDADGNALEGYETQVMSLKDSLNELAHYDTFGMSKEEKQFNSIDEFFGKSSSAGMKDRFTELATAGQMDVEAIKSLGLTSKDFGGAALQDVVKYFNDITASAKKAADAVTEVDGSLDGVEAASQSGNAGDDFVKIKGYLDQSKKLKDQGLTGIDDFKTVEKMITQGTGTSYDEAYNNLQKYFTTDQDPNSEYFGQLTWDGIQNFASDFLALKGSFKTTGEVAQKMGMSTQMFEAMMGRVQDYEGFDNLNASFQNMVSTSQQLNEAKSNLGELKSVYDIMENGEKKKKLCK